MKQLIVKISIDVNAAISRVWEVLTNPELTKQYMFACEIISDLNIGSPLIWKGAADGKVYVKGNVVNITPGRRLQFTVFDPNGSYEDVPSNYTTVTYELSPENGHTIFSVTQGDFVGIENGEKRYNETVAGWNSVLPKIKELAEKQ